MNIPFEDSLRSASTEAEVARLVRDYMSRWTPRELATLPECCRPGKIRDAEDIADCAIALTRARISASEQHDLLLEMEIFFAHACKRISALEGKSPSRSDSVPPSHEDHA